MCEAEKKKKKKELGLNYSNELGWNKLVLFNLVLLQENNYLQNMSSRQITEKSLSMLRSLPRLSLANLRDNPGSKKLVCLYIPTTTHKS